MNDEEEKMIVFDTNRAYIEQGYYSIQDLKDMIKLMEESEKKYKKAIQWANHKTRSAK